jgi:hypothetical protein
MKSTFAFAGLAALALSLTACPKSGESSSSSVTVGEAQEGLTESAASSQATDLTASTIEISTNFTLGGAVESAAAELRSFIASQLPCADIQIAGATLTVKYGAKPGNCTYNGHTFSGESTVSVVKNGVGEVEVDHTWKDLSNGLMKVSGSAQVTWSAANKSRHVVHDLTWTRISDGRTGHGTGDRTQTALAQGVAEGIQIDGTRTWDGASGHWELSIQSVQFRWADPVPQAGKYVLLTPKGKSLAMSFARVDADTIQVTLSSGNRSFRFNVHRAAGDVEEAA